MVEFKILIFYLSLTEILAKERNLEFYSSKIKKLSFRPCRSLSFNSTALGLRFSG